MPRRSTSHAERRRHAACRVALLLLVAAACVARASAAPQVLLLAVRLNGLDLPGDVTVVHERDAHRAWLAIDRAAWDRLGLRTAPDGVLIHEGQPYVRLSDEGPLRWTVDGPSQTLQLEADAAAFAPAGAQAGQAPRAAAAEGLPGAFAGYDIAAQRSSRGRTNADGLIRWGVHDASGSWLESWSLIQMHEGRWQHHRLETRWTTEDTARRTRWTLGDTVRPGGTTGVALPLTGLQWARDPTLEAGLQPLALPWVGGEALLPSTFELRVNGTPAMRGELGPGPFRLDELPVTMGEGRLQLAIRDALGRERIIEQAYHAHPALLRPGLRAWSLDIGRVRPDPLVRGAAGGPWVASWLERRGLTPTLTAQWRAEAVGAQRAAAATAWWRPPELPDGSSIGVLQADAERTHGPAGSGWVRGLGWSRAADRWSASARWQHADDNASLAAPGPAARWRTRLSASLGWRRGPTGLTAQTLQQADHTGEARRWMLASLSTSFAGAHQASLRWQRDGRTGERVVSVLLIMTERDGTTTAAHREASSGVTPQRESIWRWQQHDTAAAAGTPRMALQVDHSQRTHGAVELRAQSDPVTWGVGLRTGAHESTLAAHASGQLAWVAGRLHAGARQEGSAALVETDGLAGVPVMLDQRVVARTDASGSVLVTGLRGHELNRLSADVSALPMQVEVLADGVQIVPPARGVVRVRLPLAQHRAVTLRVLDATGQPLPPGSVLSSDADGARALVGHDGHTYVSWPASAGLAVTIEAGPAFGRCRLRVDFPAGADLQPDLGERRCE